MGRMPVAAQSQPSQRESAELREAQALITALKADIETHEAVLGEALNMRNSYERRMKGVQGELAECKRELKKLQPQQLTGGNASIPKIKDLSSQTFYDHVDIFYDWGKRFHTDDISPIVVAGIKKINRKAEQPDLDLLRKILMTNGMAAARNALLEGHEKEIATHLLKNFYTDSHFSILRLVGTISKRVAGLIEQSVKWVHNSDGSKSRQMLAAPPPRLPHARPVPLVLPCRHRARGGAGCQGDQPAPLGPRGPQGRRHLREGARDRHRDPRFNRKFDALGRHGDDGRHVRPASHLHHGRWRRAHRARLWRARRTLPRFAELLVRARCCCCTLSARLVRSELRAHSVRVRDASYPFCLFGCVV